MKKLISLIVAFTLLCTFAVAEEEEDEIYVSEKLYVTATLLNGRATPSKRGSIEARFDKYDSVVPTGEWSTNYEWVEVYGGETGVVWCSIKYLTEIFEPVRYFNRSKGKVKIRKKPFIGKVISYLKPGKTVEITQIVNGWGKCKRGWIDMSYLEEEIE